MILKAQSYSCLNLTRRHRMRTKFDCYFILRDENVFVCSIAEIQASLVAQMVKNWPKMQKTGSIPGWRRSPGEGNGNPFQYSCLEDSIDREAWWAQKLALESRSPNLLCRISSSRNKIIYENHEVECQILWVDGMYVIFFWVERLSFCHILYGERNKRK